MKYLLFALMLLGSIKSYSQFAGTGNIKIMTNADNNYWQFRTRIDTISCIMQVVTDWDKPKVKWVSGYAVTSDTVMRRGVNALFYGRIHGRFLTDKKKVMTEDVIQVILKP
jgi:hypothetical protein